MKKVITGLIWLLFVLTMLFPAGTWISACFGYAFVLVSVSAFAVVIAALSICVVVLDLAFKITIENRITQVLLAIITPLSFINAVFYMLESNHNWVSICVLISLGCCLFLAIKHGRPVALRKVALAISALMWMPMSLVVFAELSFGGFGQNTVVQTVESPSGKYYAQVIDSDQGALGGDTLVNVHEKNGINVILFKIEKLPQCVYVGDWGEFENMQIHWKDDSCLVINTVEYEIK